MATIKGVWKFNEIITFTEGIDQTVNFSVGVDTNLQGQTAISIISTDQRVMVKPAFNNVYRANSGWSNNRNRVFDFGETEQEVSDEFAQWLFQNANNGKVTLPATDGNTKVLVKENGITTLATAGTYCETDIDVNVEVEDKSEEAYEEGRKAEYDAFWDEYQDYGNRTQYQNAFAGWGWTINNFKPKYNIEIEHGYMLFRENHTLASLPNILEQNKIILNTKNCKVFNYMFQWSYFTRVGEIDFSSATDVVDVFNSGSLITIDKIILPDKALNFHNSFKCLALKDIIVEGSFYASVSFATAPLSKLSINSIIEALSDSVDSQNLTFSLTAVNNAFETTEGAADGSTSEEWLALTATKSNWTISLV